MAAAAKGIARCTIVVEYAIGEGEIKFRLPAIDLWKMEHSPIIVFDIGGEMDSLR